MHIARNTLGHRLGFVLACCAGSAGLASEADHREFEAMLHVPYKAESTSTGVPRQARTITLAFDYPFVETAQDVSWRVELLSPAGQPVQRWRGVERLFREPVKVRLHWDGRVDGAELPDGIYQVRMQALASPAAQSTLPAGMPEDAIDNTLAAGAGELIEQSWEMSVGATGTARMPAFNAMPYGTAEGTPVLALAAPAPASLPYTVYLGNLHSQTNHSDGGGAITSCAGAQGPQSGAFGPSDAYSYALERGLDLLVASEHNHMFDGSSGANGQASPAAAKALYQAGLTAASDFSAAHPGFLAVYGLEWGVISNGGHLNIFNTPELLEWEINSDGQPIGDIHTAKGDYAALYTLMRQRGWVGQFNHPALSGQFLVNNVPFGYTSDGDQAMALCEVLNSSAFSTNTSETETGRSTYAGACNKALEAGFHIAFSSNQDNHCANWGASYSNRTGVLIPNGVPLSATSFLDALRARRVFASMDKNAQLVLTANGHIMGERFTNSGTLNLTANFASSTGMTVSSAVIFEGVPGRNGSVSQLAATANTTITPAPGEHFYYARLTQNDGKLLWSAPVWVTQSDSGDIMAPLVTAAQSGARGGITVSADASDNVGVTLVEFYLDGQFKASSNVPPYTARLGPVAPGQHTLVTKAYDAAGNVGVSRALGFTVGN